jgi:DNA polymerase I-like protein with 3'-5' exonuclease and polymerase domains
LVRFCALFIPEPGHVLVVADYSSMELRAADQNSDGYNYLLVVAVIARELA